MNSEEDLAVLEDEALSTPHFITELRTDFVEHLNAMKALTAHGPVLVIHVCMNYGYSSC